MGSSISAKQRHAQHAEKDPALHRMLAWLVYAAGQQSVVAAVRPPCNIEHVAQDRNRSDNNLDRHVCHHARNRDVGHPSNPRRDDDDAGGDSAQIMSPMPGMKPIMPSRPKRIEVPGTLIKSSSRCDRMSRFSSSNSFAAALRCEERVPRAGQVDGIGSPTGDCQNRPRTSL